MLNKDIKDIRDIKYVKVISRIKNVLKSAGIESYDFEAKIIAEYVFNNGNADKLLESILDRRQKREPLQYILCGWEFYGDEYKLNTDCLIPRPETEFLTEYIINNAKANATVLDLCCGCGCIAVSALKRRKDLKAVAVDISPGAVAIARENAELNGVSDRINFWNYDIIKNYKNVIELNGNINLIVSNPPYLSQSEISQIETARTELFYEPRIAFYGGVDGLDFYKFIINNYSAKYSPDTVTVFEVGINQYKSVTAMFEQINFSCEIIRDYQKIERVVLGKLKN